MEVAMTEERAVSINLEDKESKESKDLQLLLDPSYSLLQRFRDKCPGTYHHSQTISGIVEGIALSLNLNVLKMKVIATYHDIGKTFNPKYFTENHIEDDEDPHLKLLPSMSYNIITRHVSDSVMILINDHKFPRDVIEVISQHHGTSILQYFFDKSGKGVEDTFRYKTTKPTGLEAAILMIVDRVEATSRSLSSSSKFDPACVIDKTINLLLDDGQLDEVVMKLGNLKAIKNALLKELEGAFSKRVDYDKAKIEVISEIDLDGGIDG
jgi:putative nucleotidyltransferase with HDIG domain